MNLTLDIGNTAVKWATFEGHTLVSSGRWTAADGYDTMRSALTGLLKASNHTLACASGDPKLLDFDIDTLSAETQIPIQLNYRTPASLGPDRIAGACGAWATHPGCDCLIVDAGTCITIDFLSSDGVYHGGAIMPGLGINLQALHTFTEKLPLISLDNVSRAPLLGRSTEECILAGTLGATMLALAGFVAAYRQRCPALQVVLTGGDAERLVKAGADAWDLQPQLTLIGLNEIILNEKE